MRGYLAEKRTIYTKLELVMVTNKLLLVLLISVVSGFCHSQHWFLRIKPMVGTPVASFQRFDKVVYDPVIDYSNGYKPSNISIVDNVELRLQYNLELFADFYQINSNWHIGAGFGLYNGSRSFLKVDYNQQNSVSVWEDHIILGNSSNAASGSIGPVDFNMYALATRRVQAEINGKSRIHQFISIGAGFTENKKNDRSWIFIPEGLFIYETYKSHNYFPFLLLRYEIDIRRVMRGKLKLVIADGKTYVDDRLIYVANDMRVGLFQTTEGF